MTVDALAVAVPEERCRRPADHHLPLARWAGLTGLLIAEVVLLTVRFDTATLGGETAWWAVLLGQSGLWLRLSIAVVTATLLVSGDALWDELQRISPQNANPRWWLWLLPHTAAYVTFYGLTALLLEGSSPWDGFAIRPTSVWFVLWLVTGALTLALAALAAMPPRRWLALAHRGRRGIALGVLLGLAALAASSYTGQWWMLLAQLTFWVVQGLLSLFYTNLVCDPADLVVGTSLFKVQISSACSGYEGMGLILVFTLVYLVVCRTKFRFPHALVLLPVGVAVIWLCNALRLAALIAIGTAGWPELALGGFHSQAGWLVFNGVALGLAACGGRIKLLTAGNAPIYWGSARHDRMHAVTTNEADPTLAYLAPFLAVLASRMFVQAFSSTPELLYPLEVLAALAALVTFRRSYTPARCSWSWPALALGSVTALLWAGWVLAFPAEPRAFSMAAVTLSQPWAAAWGLFRILGYVVVVPIVEELAFRGYLLRRLVAVDFQAVPATRFTWVSFLVSSILFGALHGANWLPGILAGMLFALAVYRRGRLSDAVAAHITANLLLALYGLYSHNQNVLS